jgi:hypothetical protein
MTACSNYLRRPDEYEHRIKATDDERKTNQMRKESEQSKHSYNGRRKKSACTMRKCAGYLNYETDE